jgi:hypothetical protein
MRQFVCCVKSSQNIFWAFGMGMKNVNYIEVILNFKFLSSWKRNLFSSYFSHFEFEKKKKYANNSSTTIVNFIVENYVNI